MRRMNRKTFHPGFTLVELAIVIAIVAILGAVAIPAMGNMSGKAEASVIQGLQDELQDGASMYMAGAGVPPASFSAFVASRSVDLDTSPGPGSNGNQVYQTISLETFGPHAATQPCVIRATEITCNGGTFSNFRTVRYVYNPAVGTVTMTNPSDAELRLGSN